MSPLRSSEILRKNIYTEGQSYEEDLDHTKHPSPAICIDEAEDISGKKTPLLLKKSCQTESTTNSGSGCDSAQLLSNGREFKLQQDICSKLSCLSASKKSNENEDDSSFLRIP